LKVKQRQDYEREQKARDAAREARDRTLSTGTRGGKGSRAKEMDQEASRSRWRLRKYPGQIQSGL
jgi:hypothetical protein